MTFLIIALIFAGASLLYGFLFNGIIVTFFSEDHFPISSWKFWVAGVGTFTLRIALDLGLLYFGITQGPTIFP